MLTPSERNAYERDGFAGPFRAFSADEIAAARDVIERDVLSQPGLDPQSNVQSRHLDSRVVLSLCTAPPILSRAESALGGRIVLWRSNFFEKVVGAGELGWHRDSLHWRSILKPMINVSAWLALDRANAENGCVQVIAGSHRRAYTSPDGNPRFVDVGESDAERLVPMHLEPGEFFLFDCNTVHASGANASHGARLGLAIRFTVPGVAIDRDALFPAHRCIDI